MASSSGASGSAPLPPEPLDHGERSRPLLELQASSTASEGSLSGGSGPATCVWRTPQFHNQECLRYFDCPSHSVERRLSMDENHGALSDERARPAGRDPTGDELYSSEAEHDSLNDGIRNMRMASDIPPVELEAGPSQTSHGREISASGAGEPMAYRTDALQGRTIPTSSSSEPSLVTFHELGDSAPASPITDRARVGEGQSIDQTELPGSPLSPLSRHSGRAAASIPTPGRIDVGYEQPVSPLSTRRTHQAMSRDSPDFVLPRWQPDAEATYCPICYTQFSIFVRKHHCR